MAIAQLISAAELEQLLDDKNRKIVVIDCRFALEDSAYGLASFQQGHIATAQFADLEQDLSGPVSKGVTGRHPLPDPATLSAKLQAWGVDDDSQIVLYDDGPGAFAARAWWLLAWLGKRSGVALLDGGLRAWREAGLGLTAEVKRVEPGNFIARPDNQLLISAAQLQHRLQDTQLTLLDARALPRFRGEVEPLDPVAGHIPGAQCATFTENLDAQGRFLTPAQLQERFATLLGSRPASDLVAYCGSGVTACHNLFALCLAGYPLAPLYAGSWSEWITQPERPVAVGD
ncbi:putative 3-mercaptopyruvate sulfurtransferase [Pseudomonas marincola]|uniref:Sulfurtransferase n=1 Tax=Pseudomonas marincola TaxID=437900 RepID=A0A653EBA3_9PSED|nr:sulfurtransferase [Pseudomonas marincola]CAE6929323.1 putative 3-mercaptopyruvate sulfurtransferase [Pseudomonas marincola]